MISYLFTSLAKSNNSGSTWHNRRIDFKIENVLNTAADIEPVNLFEDHK